MRRQVGGRRAQHGGRGPADRLQHRRVGAAVAQFAQLVGLAFGQVGVELFQPLAVVLLQLRPRQLEDAGEQTILQCERRGFDDEVAWHLVGPKAASSFARVTNSPCASLSTLLRRSTYTSRSAPTSATTSPVR